MTLQSLALYSAQDVKKLDSLSLAHHKLTGYQLMLRAGMSAWQLLCERFPYVKELTIFCGQGNNGGDGFVLACIAKEHELHVRVVALTQPNQVWPEAASQAHQAWLDKDGIVEAYTEEALQCDLIVDAIFGIGVRAPLPSECITIIEKINQSGIPVLAIDIPSGLHADTGSNLGAVVKADCTISFIALKTGLFLKDAVDYVGEIIFNSLDISENLYDQVTPCAYRLDYDQAIAALKKRKRSGHKGDYGHVLVIGGGHLGYSGAPALASEAAMRAGAGLVSAIVSPQALPLLSRAPKELMCYAPTEPTVCAELFSRITVCVVGPGLSQTDWGKTFFQTALSLNKPMVVDADGLNWLSKFPQFSKHWILTPHPGEAARLLNVSTEQIQADRLQAAKDLQQRFGGVVVLKGAGTVIVDEAGKVFINEGGNPALATAGSGDILAGLIGGLLAQGLTLSQAALLGVSVHTHAALLEQSFGERGMIASDLLLHIRSLLNVFRAK